MKTTRTPRPTHSSLLFALVLGAACADAGSVGVVPEEPSSVHVVSADRRHVFVPPGARADTAVTPVPHGSRRSVPPLIGARVLADGRIVGRDGAVLGRLRTPPGASGDAGGTVAAAGGYDASARTPPRTVDVSPGLPMVAARDGDDECWWLVVWWSDTGEIVSITFLGCGDGGGSEDEPECTEDQKAIAAEYDNDGEWPCDVFVDAVTPGDGTHGHKTGYLSSRYKSGRDAVWSYMRANHGVKGWINSDWRCPTGNRHPDVLGSADSRHVRGLAGDFDARGFDLEMAGWFLDAGIDAGATERIEYRGHYHLGW